MSNLPAYMLIRQYVIEMVFSRQNRSKPLPTERELCARFQVSRTVVRMALDDLRHDGFLEARARHGLFIAPDCEIPSSSRFPKLLLLAGDGRYIFLDNALFEIHAWLFDAFKALPFRLSPVTLNAGCPPDEELLFHSASGILWLDPMESVMPSIRKLREKIPVVILFGDDPADPDSVCFDYASAGRQAALWFQSRGLKPHLIGSSRGHRRLGFRKGWLSLFPDTAEREVPLSQCSREHFDSLFSNAVPEGIFTFSSELPILAESIRKFGWNGPVLTDSIPGPSDYPVAEKIDLYTRDLVERAVRKLTAAVR